MIIAASNQNPNTISIAALGSNNGMTATTLNTSSTSSTSTSSTCSSSYYSSSSSSSSPLTSPVSSPPALSSSPSAPLSTLTYSTPNHVQLPSQPTNVSAHPQYYCFEQKQQQYNQQPQYPSRPLLSHSQPGHTGTDYYAPPPIPPPQHKPKRSAHPQHMHALTLSVEPMRTVPSPAAASLSPVGAGANAASSGTDWSRTHGHSRSNSMVASRRPSMDLEEKPDRPARLPSPLAMHSHSHSLSLSMSHSHSYAHSHSHSHSTANQSRGLSPLTGPAHFPPAWSHHIYGEAQGPPRTRPPVRELLMRGVRERLACNSKGSLGRGLIIGWVVTTLMFVGATAFWKGELFSALDRLSKNLYDMGYQGLVVFGVLIFITTIPPLPLYSTLIVLSGYTFGIWNGFVASYIASLVGAVFVFIVSRTWLRDTVTRSLASSPTASSLLQIIPQNPHLLLLIRIAPYPYNLLNVVLASAPTLTLKTYTCCTAISLCKLVLHTWIGAGIHDISAAYNSAPPADGNTPPAEQTPEDAHHERVKTGVTWGGIVLCAVLFVYLTHVAKRAIAKAQHEQRVVREEEIAFLTPLGDARDLDSE